MTKKELIDSVAETTGYTKKDTKAVTDALFETIMATVVAGEEVSIAGFGKFENRPTSARTAINPQTGEKLEIAASKKPAFKPSAPFKTAVKER